MGHRRGGNTLKLRYAMKSEESFDERSYRQRMQPKLVQIQHDPLKRLAIN